MNFYPVEEAQNSNLRHRPIGIGVQGLADAFILMRFPFDRLAKLLSLGLMRLRNQFFLEPALNKFLTLWQQV